MEFVGFSLPVPPSEEAHHPLHPRPPPLPGLSPLPLLQMFLVIFSFWTDLFGTWVLLLEKVLIWRKELRWRSFAPFNPEKSAWEGMEDIISDLMLPGEKRRLQGQVLAKQGQVQEGSGCQRLGLPGLVTARQRTWKNGYFKGDRWNLPKKLVPTVAVNLLLELVKPAGQELIGTSG